jgi:CDP-glucose 4,6-dehydratase
MPSFWKNRTALVTGATGFVGAHIARLLVERQANVVCLQRDAVRANLLDLFDLRRRVTVVTGVVEDLELCSRILNEYAIDAVFHLAAQALVGAANSAPLSTFESNIRGTYCLLEACRRSESVTRIVVASSDKAYGSHTEQPCTEEHALHARFPYDVSKACTDLMAQSFAHTYDLPVTITRSANIYGPGDLNISRIVPGTILSVLDGENPVIRSDGTPIREFIHVHDVADGYLLLAENIAAAKGQAYNLGANEPVQIHDLVTRIIDSAGKRHTLTPTVQLTSKIPGEIDAQYLSTAKLQRQFGWTAKCSLNASLHSTIAWYNAHRAAIQSTATAPHHVANSPARIEP